MRLNREGNMVSEFERECSNKKCKKIFPITSKRVTLCHSCNCERVKATKSEAKMLMRAKNRARIKKLEFNIDIKDIQIPKYCPILGSELQCTTGRSGGQKNSPALDRIDCSKGYIKGNVRVISHLANMMKSYATNKELIDFSKWITTNIIS